MCNFNRMAIEYSNSVKKVPQLFLELLCRTFHLDNNDNVLEIGCGAGTLTLPLSSYACKIDAIDISSHMIELAKKNDVYNRVNWKIADANSIEYDELRYKLIMFYETFHLFLNPLELLYKLKNSLLINGSMCVGFCVYNWETSLAEDIIQILKHHNIDLSNWFIQIPDKFDNIILEHLLSSMSEITQKQVEVYEKWTAKQIARFVTSTSIFLSISTIKIRTIQDELENMIIRKYSDVFEGNSKYIIRFSTKLK